MDRADKVKKYRTKMNSSRYRQIQSPDGTARLRLLGIGALAVMMIIILFLSLYHKKKGSDLAYVTQEEFASLMSFYTNEPLDEKWKKKPAAAVTCGDLKDVIQKTGLSGVISAAGGNEKASREMVMDYYSQILDYLDLEEAVSKKTILLLHQSDDFCKTNAGKLNMNINSVDLEDFHTYDVYLIGKTILGVCGESSRTKALKGVTASEVKKGRIVFEYQEEEYQIACEETDELREGAGCTLYIKDGRVTKIKDIKLPEDNGQKQKEIQTAQNLAKSVKVLLLNQGDVHYDEVYLVCDTKCRVKKGKQKRNYKKSNVIPVHKLKIKKGKYASVSPAESSGRIYLADKSGSQITKGYYGSLNIYRDSEGYYIVNKVNVEKYLYSVVASEMPSYFELEALKAQAVCARSYVYRQMNDDHYRAYHAQIDDSTNYQVYNKSDISDVDIRAVQETAGEVMYAQDEIVNAYYFSASCGYISGMEIWNQKDTLPYLTAKALNESGKKFDLSDEEAFRKYITSTDKTAFDSGSPYYRWTARVELSSRVEQLRERIMLRRDINPDNITFYAAGKKKKVSSLKGFGGVKKIYCSKRSKSGAILVLTIEFEFGKVEVKSEYNIRSIVGCAMEKITYADGSENTSAEFLPSAYFSISFDKKSGRFLLYGGGNGHGMGMSQYGADSMAEKGWNYEQILKFFYDKITIKKVS